MPAKFWGMPIREALTIAGLLIAIGIAWGVSQASISAASAKAERNAHRITKLREEITAGMKELKEDLKDEIKENRRTMYELLKKGTK